MLETYQLLQALSTVHVRWLIAVPTHIDRPLLLFWLQSFIEANTEWMHYVTRVLHVQRGDVQFLEPSMSAHRCLTNCNFSRCKHCASNH